MGGATADMWHERAKRRRDEVDRSARRIATQLPAVIARLLSSGVKEAYLFGSRAGGRARADSDVDIAVSGCVPAEFFRVAADLERLLQMPLDLIDLDMAPADFASIVRATGRRIIP